MAGKSLLPLVCPLWQNVLNATADGGNQWERSR